jgi:hypothetical protein
VMVFPLGEMVKWCADILGRWSVMVPFWVILTMPCFVIWVRGWIPFVVKAYFEANVGVSGGWFGKGGSKETEGRGLGAGEVGL